MRLPSGRRQGGGFSATNATLRDLVAHAYQRHPFDSREVIGGPAWIDNERFDVAANAAAEHVMDADGGFRRTWAMLGRLLADRFNVKLHEEDRDRPVYALRLLRSDGALGPRLQKTAIDCGESMRSGGPPAQPGKGPPCSTKNPPGRLFASTVSLPTIASLLSAPSRSGRHRQDWPAWPIRCRARGDRHHGAARLHGGTE